MMHAKVIAKWNDSKCVNIFLLEKRQYYVSGVLLTESPTKWCLSFDPKILKKSWNIWSFFDNSAVIKEEHQ